MASKKKTTREIGDMGEAAVVGYLRLRGFRILARNFTVKGGEIDIVACRFGTVAFVEVKTRNALTDTEKYGTPAAAVGREKQECLRFAAARYLAKYPSSRKPRFDVAEVLYRTREGKKPLLKIRYRKEAF